jgi:NAD(P)-dependent dehydrogenase (short-subunit alcohol dehydrogenase family)/acyl carrier protein
MDMEADLGIDSIKRVEIMSAMQEKLPEAPVIQPDQLGKLRTLGQILEFLSARATTGETSAAATTPSLSADKIAETLIEVIAEKTGYPVDMLNPEMDMEADLGIDSIKRVEILSAFQEKEPDAPIVQPGDLGKFRTISQILDFLSAGNNEQPTEQTPVSEVKTPTADTEIPTTGRENLAELQRSVLVCEELSGNPEGERVLNEKDLVLVADDGSDFSKALAHEFAEKGCNTEVLSLPDIIAGKFSKAIKALVLTAPVPVRDKDGLWSEAAEEWLKDAFLATREAGMAIKTNGKGLIATVSRLDGAFGLTNPTKTIDPVQGGLAGLSKTIAHEWPELQSRAIDLDYRFKDAKASARKLVEELMYAGPQETGLTKSGRFTLKTKEIAVKEEHNAAATFTNDDLILATGGARGVTAATAIAFAKKFKAGMVLLGRSAAPADEPEWLAPLTAEAEIKGAILKNSEKKLTPKELEAGFKKHMANREILQTLKQIKDCGARVWYYSADLRSEKEVSEVIASVQKDGGNIRGLIHGAGVLRDRKIEDKTREQLDDVIDTKVKGLRIVLKALKKADLKAIVLFSSFSGRFGRSGQVDYAMANEVLNKAAHKLKILRPDCKVLSFNWGPWDGGMVTPNLRNLFIAEGTGLIDVQAGAWQPIVELSRENDALEICIIGARGQTHPQEGSGPKKLLKAFDYELKLDTNAWLKSHVINGDAVLPMAVTAEMLIHLATMKNPELKFVGYDDLRVLKGIVLKEGKRKISFYSTEPTKDGNNYKIATEIRSNHNGKEIVNAKATILLSDSYNLSAPAPLNVDSHLVYPDSINEIYSNKLFHGEFFQALTKVAGWSEKGITALANTALPPGNWSNDSLCPRWYSDPLAIDAAFQLMILWSIQTTGAPSLPTFAQKYRQYCNHFPEQVTIRASAKRNTDHSAIADIDFLDSNGQVLARMNGYECTINEALKQAFKSRTVVGA